MPKFLYSIYVITLFMWSILAFLLFNTSPNNYPSIFIFLFVLYGALGFTLSLPFYYFLTFKFPNFTNPNILYKRALKWGLYISSGVAIFLLLKSLDLLNLLNGGLFILLYIGFFFQLKGKK